MTNITDELRAYAHTRISPNKGMLTAIADRIDTKLAECYVELPLSADKAPVHIGDVMEHKSNCLHDDSLFEVRALRFGEVGWEAIDRLGDRYEPSMLRHHQPDSWERIIMDAVAAGRTDKAINVMPLINRCKELAGEDV